jgi:hypothetical protein
VGLIVLVELLQKILQFWFEPVVGDSFFGRIIDELTESCVLHVVCKVLLELSKLSRLYLFQL